MKITPLDKYAEPRFPTRAILDEHPELLRIIPERWQRNPVVLTAMAGLCLLILSSKDLEAAPWKSASKVAPIFKHGNGYGDFGCVAVNPPVFLSEAEARQVIVEEGKKAGLTFTLNAPQLRSVRTPMTEMYGSCSYKSGTRDPKFKTCVRPLKLDGTDKKRRISFEYVSQTDFDAWKKKEGILGSAYSYDILEAAKSLRDGLVKVGPKGAYAVFYDPLSHPGSVKLSYSDKSLTNKDWAAERVRRDKEAKNTARQELRKQVKDFIVWLKSQGVI